MSKSVRKIVDSSIKINYETPPLDSNDRKLADDALQSCIRASVLLETNNKDPESNTMDFANEKSKSIMECVCLTSRFLRYQFDKGKPWPYDKLTISNNKKVQIKHEKVNVKK